MMSPYLQKTLDLGADIEYHSGTKYLSGHHDLMAGVIACKEKKVAEVFLSFLFILYSMTYQFLLFSSNYISLSMLLV